MQQRNAISEKPVATKNTSIANSMEKELRVRLGGKLIHNNGKVSLPIALYSFSAY